jgi:signal transduction histidine kinase
MGCPESGVGVIAASTPEPEAPTSVATHDTAAERSRPDAPARAARSFRLALDALFAAVVLGLLVLDGILIGALRPELRTLARLGDDHLRAVTLATRLGDSVTEERRRLTEGGDGELSEALSTFDDQLQSWRATARSLEMMADGPAERLVVERLRSNLARCSLEAARLRVEASRPVGVGPLVDCVGVTREATDGVVLMNARRIQRSTRGLRASLVWAIALTTLLTAVIAGAALLLRRSALRSATRCFALMRAHADDMAEFAARVAHELRTPLQTLSLVLAVARRGRTDVLDRAESAVRRLSETIDGVLEFSRAGAAAVTQGNAALDAVLDDVAEDLALRGTDARLALERDTPPGVAVAMAPGHLRTVLMNLVGNAVKYAAGGPASRVRVRARDLGASVEIVVSDNGPGIPSEALPHVFEPYFRATQRPEGFGLGLATVKRLVEACGGGITVTSEARHGTTFTVALPPARGGRVVAARSRTAEPPIP